MKEIIEKTVDILKKGQIIMYPTDTIWGIGCDATDFDAVSRIYEIKKRMETKSMLILVNSKEMLENYTESIPDIAYQLIEASTRPLTIVYPIAKNLAKNLPADDGSIGIRITSNDFCVKLINAFGRPIVSTSANFAGEKSPLGFFDISEEIKNLVDYIVPLKQEEFSPRKSSDIIKVKLSGEIQIIR